MSQEADEQRLAIFASPEESMVGDAGIRRLKREYIQNIWAGDSEDEAAERILTKPEIVALWKRQDARFNQLVEETLALFEAKTLRRLEENLIWQALMPNAKGAHLALSVLERRKPEKWAKQSTTNVKVEVAGDITHHLSELLDDPTPIEAEYREVNKEHDEQ